MKLKTVLSALCLTLIILLISIGNYIGNSRNEHGLRQLNYYINFTGFPITLDLWEAESYYPAVVVQQLVGNLIYYSNQGRYETRLADNWERVSENKWRFSLRDGFTCEDGEKITPSSFKRSIERSLYVMAKRGDTPILKHLKGYEAFISQNRNVFELESLDGIKVDKNNIIFEFVRPIRNGVIEILSFAPYGYICKNNLTEEGKWRDPKKFISSGYYSISNVVPGDKYTLISRLNVEETDFRTINIYQGLPNQLTIEGPTVVDTNQPLINNTSGLHRLSLFKEYVSAVSLGNLKAGIFANLENRITLRSVMSWVKEKKLSKYYDGPISWSLFPYQRNIKPNIEDEEVARFKNIFADRESILIRGKEPAETSPAWPTWMILREALEYLDIKYSFSHSKDLRKDLINQNYDIRITMPSLGGGVEAWTLEYLFCSGLGSALPDPSGRICSIVLNYQNGVIAEDALIDNFLNISNEDAAVIPVYHFGREKYFSEHFNLSSVSPLISVIRMDKLEANK